MFLTCRFNFCDSVRFGPGYCLRNSLGSGGMVTISGGSAQIGSLRLLYLEVPRLLYWIPRKLLLGSKEVLEKN